MTPGPDVSDNNVCGSRLSLGGRLSSGCHTGQEVSRADDALRIAIVAPAWYPLPPRGYGGTELVVHLLLTELRRLGHDVTAFGAEGSAQGVTMLADAAWSQDLGGPAEMGRQAPYLGRVYAPMAGRRLDVIHDHTGFKGPLLSRPSGLRAVVG